MKSPFDSVDTVLWVTPCDLFPYFHERYWQSSFYGKTKIPVKLRPEGIPKPPRYQQTIIAAAPIDIGARRRETPIP